MDKVRQNIIFIMFSVLPFGFLSFGIIHVGQHLAFLIAFVAILASTVKNNWITGFFWYLCAWILFICIFRMAYGMPNVVFGDAMNQFIFFSGGLAIYSAIANQKTNIQLETYYNIICIAALIQAGMAISQFFGFDPVIWGLNLFTDARPFLDPNTMTGTLGNNNFLSAYVAISLPFFFRKNWFYGIILLVPVLYFGKTTSAFVPAIIGTTLYFWPKLNNKLKVIVVSLGAVSCVFYAVFQHTPFYLNPRWVAWSKALGLWFYSPYSVAFGRGPGAGWGESYPMHNEWLQGLYQFGIIGLALMCGYVLTACLTTCRKNRILFTAFIIAIINMFGNYSLHLSPSAFLIIIIAGLIERERI